MNVFIIESQRMTRSMLVRFCSSDLGHTVLGDIATVAEMPPSVRRLPLDLLLLGIELADRDAFEALEAFRRTVPEPFNILVLSSTCSSHLAHRVARACVHGFVDKSTDTVDALRTAIIAIQQGQCYFSPTYWQIQGGRQRQPVRYDQLLTGQELKVFELLAQLIDDADIATQLGISLRTLEGHRLRIMDKLDVSTRIALLRYAREMGLLAHSIAPFEVGSPRRNPAKAAG